MCSQVDNCNHLNGNGQDEHLEWFNKDYLKNVLTTYNGHPVEIKSLIKKPATVKGENFASAMHLINAEYIKSDPNFCKNQIKKISLIVKSQLDNELFAEIQNDFNIFERESQVYRIIMKECEKLLRTIGDMTIFGPRAIYIAKGVIVQENLKEKGYEICDIKKGLDFKHCLIFIKKLAKFHACSMVAYEQSPEYFVHHMPGNLTESNENPLHDFYRNAIASCIEFCENVPTLQIYANKLKMFSKNIIKSVCQTFTRNSPNAIYVLNHGDVWCNNLMYKNNLLTDELEDVLMVDYQEGYYGSLGIDWNYFMYSSWNKNVYIKHKDELIKEYHKILSETLIKLKYNGKIPTLMNVYDEIKLKGEHGLVTATCLLPILINPHQHLSDPENFLLNSNEAKLNRSIVFNNSQFIEFLELYLSDFVKNDIL